MKFWFYLVNELVRAQTSVCPIHLYLIFEKSSSTNWIFSLFQTGVLLPVQPAKINFEIDFSRLKLQFVELEFSNLIFQNSSTDQQGELRLGTYL